MNASKSRKRTLSLEDFENDAIPCPGYKNYRGSIHKEDEEETELQDLATCESGNVLWLFEGVETLLSTNTVKSVLKVITTDNASFEPHTTENPSDLSAGLFYIMLSAISSKEEKFRTINKLRLLGSAGIVAAISHDSKYRKRLQNIEDCVSYVLMAVTIAIYEEAFKQERKMKRVAVGITTPAKYQFGYTEIMFLKDMDKIKKRWEILEKIAPALSGGDDIGSAAARALALAGVQRVKRALFKKLLQKVKKYGNSGEFNLAVGEGKKPLQQAVDVSFATCMIDDQNFEQACKGVKKRLINFFPVADPLPVDFYGKFDDLWNEGAKKNFSLDCDYSDQQQSAIDDKQSCKSVLGVYWKHKARNSLLRNNALKCCAAKLLDVVYGSGDSGQCQSRVLKQLEDFDRLSSRIWLFQFSSVLRYWPLPYNLLLHVLKYTAPMLKQPLTNSLPISGGLRVSNWRSLRFDWLLERIVSEFGFEAISDSLMDDSLKSLVALNMDFTEKYKASLTHKRIKNLVLFMASCPDLAYTIFMEVLEMFPWLLNTWIDHRGNTLLCLLLMNGYRDLRDLVQYPLIKKHIDVESKDGLTPLMLAAGLSSSVTDFCSLVLVGGADPRYVNRNHESVLHRAACSNNARIIELYEQRPGSFRAPHLELRRKGDAATALMIALSRQHLDAADKLMAMGALATTRFGASKSLRTADALLLKKRGASVSFLADKGIVPSPNIIMESYLSGALFEEEGEVAPTGLIDLGRICITPPHRGIHRKSRGKGGDNAGVPTNINGLAVRLHDLTWTMFGDAKTYSKFEWPIHLIRNNVDKLTKAVKAEVEKASALLAEGIKDYGLQECPICLCSLDAEETNLHVDDNDDDIVEVFPPLSRGITKCGHAFHTTCWRRLTLEAEAQQKCPVCRQVTTFRKEQVTWFSPEPPGFIQDQTPPMQRPHKVEQLNESDPRVAGYLFEIDGEWVHESSPLNVII